MYRSSASACGKHLERAARDVLGCDGRKSVSLIKRSGDPQHFCYCGKPADFQILALETSSDKEKAPVHKA